MFLCREVTSKGVHTHVTIGPSTIAMLSQSEVKQVADINTLTCTVCSTVCEDYYTVEP